MLISASHSPSIQFRLPTTKGKESHRIMVTGVPLFVGNLGMLLHTIVSAQRVTPLLLLLLIQRRNMDNLQDLEAFFNEAYLAFPIIRPNLPYLLRLFFAVFFEVTRLEMGYYEVSFQRHEPWNLNKVAIGSQLNIWSVSVFMGIVDFITFEGEQHAPLYIYISCKI